MSIAVERFSLLGALTPLRHTTDRGSAAQEKGFAERLDKALGGADVSAAQGSGTARELAQSLTLQMLHSSLAISGDSSADSSASVKSPVFSSTHALLQAYRDNLAGGGEAKAAPSAQLAPPSQLQDFVEESPPASPSSPAPKAHLEANWLDQIVSKASQKYGVDVGLIKAVIKAESDFNPQAVSHAGARGLMQLMPATARSLGVADSFDPEQNVMGGTRFLKDMLQRYGGDVDAALAAYNWGPGNVDRRPDHLPRETRDYLARVKKLYASYTS